MYDFPLGGARLIRGGGTLCCLVICITLTVSKIESMTVTEAERRERRKSDEQIMKGMKGSLITWTGLWRHYELSRCRKRNGELERQLQMEKNERRKVSQQSRRATAATNSNS